MVCPALGEHCPILSRRWCNQSAYLNPITQKHDNYLKTLNRILTDMHCFGNLYQMKDYFLIIDLLAYCNILNNPYSTYHPKLYHR